MKNTGDKQAKWELVTFLHFSLTQTVHGQLLLQILYIDKTSVCSIDKQFINIEL